MSQEHDLFSTWDRTSRVQAVLSFDLSTAISSRAKTRQPPNGIVDHPPLDPPPHEKSPFLSPLSSLTPSEASANSSPLSSPPPSPELGPWSDVPQLAMLATTSTSLDIDPSIVQGPTRGKKRRRKTKNSSAGLTPQLSAVNTPNLSPASIPLPLSIANTPAPSPGVSVHNSPVPTPNISANNSPAPSTSALPITPQTTNAETKRKHEVRKKQRRVVKDHTPPGLGRKKMGAAEAVHTAFDAGDMHDETSGYLGRKSRVPDGDGLIYTLDELVGPQSKHGFQKHSIPPGCTSVPIIDKNNTVIGVLVGPPKGDKTWEDVTATAAAKLDAAEKDLWFDQKRLSHKRGKFPVQPYGFSFGGGQEFPKRIYHTDKNEKILKNLTSLACFKRLAGHANGAFVTWAPDLYRLYCDYDSRLREKHPDCTCNFPNSIWACATYNFGPKTVTVQHLDHLNYIFGWCAITALGDFDHTKGGHFVLWELGLVLELPPGWTILIPSSYVRHSNTPISNDETRYSFTQYTAGGLFRWVDDGFQLRRTMSKEQRRSARARDDTRLRDGMGLYSTLEQLRLRYEKK